VGNDYSEAGRQADAAQRQIGETWDAQVAALDVLRQRPGDAR
jgi:hypothetical protein